MPESKEPHWHLNIEKLFKYTLVVAAGCGVVFGKANVGDVDKVKEVLPYKADRSELKTVDDRLRSEEVSHADVKRYAEWISQDVKKANDKLDKIDERLQRLIETMLASRRRGGDAGANDGNSPGLPGKDSGKPSPQPSINGGNPVGPNPLNGD